MQIALPRPLALGDGALATIAWPEDSPMLLKQLGWNSYFEALWDAGDRSKCVSARVLGQQRKFWRIAGEFGECWAEPSGRCRLAAESSTDWPAVGDWVAAEMQASAERAVIQTVLPRRSQFVRKAVGKNVQAQVVAANVDTVFLVMGLDQDFNLRRLERYLAQCWESGARPFVILNKADLCIETPSLMEHVKRAALGISVIAISAKTGEGMEQFEPYLRPGQTVVLLGSSGVGKSTLVNRLLGENVQSVQPVRVKDSRGRHTTTSRQLIFLPSGAMIIDTPGLRELQLWDASEGLTGAFADIESLAARCRFRNCRHETEPGCAVRAALDSGELDAGRLENRRKLLREQEFLRRKIDPEARQEWKKQVKSLHREVKRMYEGRKK